MPTLSIVLFIIFCLLFLTHISLSIILFSKIIKYQISNPKCNNSNETTQSSGNLNQTTQSSTNSNDIIISDNESKQLKKLIITELIILIIFLFFSLSVSKMNVNLNLNDENKFNIFAYCMVTFGFTIFILNIVSAVYLSKFTKKDECNKKKDKRDVYNYYIIQIWIAIISIFALWMVGLGLGCFTSSENCEIA